MGNTGVYRKTDCPTSDIGHIGVLPIIYSSNQLEPHQTTLDGLPLPRKTGAGVSSNHAR
jgi:hypothetical protein